MRVLESTKKKFLQISTINYQLFIKVPNTLARKNN